MPLSCSCDYEGEAAWYCDSPKDYTTLDTQRRRRCSSCKTLIDIGATVGKFPRYRYANDDIEARIYGEGHDAVQLSPLYLCEPCMDIYYNLEELGYECISPEENMAELLAEYREAHSKAPSQADKTSTGKPQ